MHLPFHFWLPEGEGTLYLAKQQRRWPTLVRGHVRGLIDWAIPIPDWTPYLLLAFLLGAFVFLGRSAGLLRLHPASTPVEAASSPALSVPDSVRSALDSARGYAEAGDWDHALASTSAAVAILEKAKRSGVRMPDESFDSLTAGLDGITVLHVGPALESQLIRARTVLAEYRSALEPAPLLPDDRTTFAASRKLAPNSRTGTGDFFFPVLDGHGLPKGAEFFLPPSPLFISEVWVEDLTIVGGAQTLDGIHWRGVMFINSHIRYQGGELELRDVRFANCTFEIAETARGENVARYMALDSPVLVLD